MTGFGADPWYAMQLPYQWDFKDPFEDLRAAIETLRGKIHGIDARELQQKDSWVKIVKDCEKPLKSAVARCLDWWRMHFGGEFPVYITKFSGWKKFAKDIGKEETRELFGMSQRPFFQRVLDPENPNDKMAIEEHNNKKDKVMILKSMFFQRLKNSCAIFQEEGPQWMMEEGCDPNVENLVTAILWLYSPMKLQKDCLVTQRPACQFHRLDSFWRHEDKGYVFNSLTRPEAFFEQQHPADLMPDKTRLPEWSMAVLENPQGDPFELENHDVEDMASASVPKKTLVLQIHEEGKSNRKRQTLRGWPVLYEDEWENIEKMLKLGTYAASNEIAFFRMGALVEEPQNQDVAKLDADALQNLIHEEHGRAEESGKLSATVDVNITKITPELHIPELSFLAPMRSESMGELRKRLAAKFGIGKSRLLLSQGKDGRNLLEDDVQLESLLEDELKLATAGNISKIKIEINYLKGFDHPHIMKILEEDFVVHGPLPHWRFSTATLRGPVHRAAAARAALIDVASGLRHLHQNGWGHMDVQPCNLQIAGQVKKDTPESVDLKLCLVDAGSAGLLGSELRTWSSRYALSQVRSGDTKTMKKALDWFALGMTVKDLAEGLWPQVTVGEETPLTLVEASEKTQLHEAASAASDSTSTFSLVAFPQGSVERLSEVDSFLVDDAERKLQPGLQLENFDTVVDHDINARRESVLKKVRENGRILESVPSVFKSMQDVVMAAVQQTGWALQFADDEHRGNRDIVLAAVRRDGQALEFASSQLQKDPEVVLEAVKNSGWALEFASDSLRNAPAVVAEAVRFNPWALELAEKLQQNYVLTWDKQPTKGVESKLPLTWAALKL
ncbi:unnamed protein product [Cladocopium goreaui]|uniref:DUF4116 domain-containing protein n=1 Tax=Cladocopium goreaui TaxID=2562237 RepID=A0A9P1D6H9_9DINO|nr:unnamed protein product [Cladocopium goreaui]